MTRDKQLAAQQRRRQEIEKMRTPKDFDFETRELEANEELDAVAWAENHGWLVRKMQYVGRRSCPDRLFVGYGKMFLAELKRPSAKRKAGGGLSTGQEQEFKRFAERDVEVKVFYSGEDVIAFLKSHM